MFFDDFESEVVQSLLRFDVPIFALLPKLVKLIFDDFEILLAFESALLQNLSALPTRHE